MKREIKYRARVAGENRWVYGYLREIFGLKERAFTICPAKHFANDGFTDLDEVSVDAETICQATPLRDVNGTTIYEGDYVYVEDNTTAVTMLIYFDEEECAFMGLPDPEDRESRHFLGYPPNAFIVKGNKFNIPRD